MERWVREPLFWELGEPLLHILVPLVMQAFPSLLRVGAQGLLLHSNDLGNKVLFDSGFVGIKWFFVVTFVSIAH